MPLLVLCHGESLWNSKNVFTGWVDVPLSKKGITEAQNAGKLISNIRFDIIFVSTLVRSLETAMLIMAENNGDLTPVVVHRSGKASARARIYSGRHGKGNHPGLQRLEA